MTESRVRVGVVINPTSGGGAGARHGRHTLAMLEGLGYEVSDLSGPDLLTATHNARQGAIEGLDALVVVGGDGMVHLGVNAVAATGVKLGVVAVGSGDDFARSLGLPRHNPQRSVDVIDEALRAGTHRAVDAVRVRHPHSLDGRWFAGVLCAGLDAAIAARANRIAFPKGRLKYVRAVIGELGVFKPYGYKITYDGGVWESPGTIVTIANTPMFGGGMRVAPEARFDDGLLDLVIAGPLSRLAALRIFPKVYRGTHVSHSAIMVLRTASVLIEATGAGARAPIAFADGEEVGPLPLQLDVHAGAIHLLA